MLKICYLDKFEPSRSLHTPPTNSSVASQYKTTQGQSPYFRDHSPVTLTLCAVRPAEQAKDVIKT